MESKSYWAQEYWNERYSSGGNSGYGSYDEQLSRKLAWLSSLHGIESITEVGCGDFHFGSRVSDLFQDATYLGLDISDVIVERNRKTFLQHVFRVMDGDTEIPQADLVLCVDVLFHIPDDQVSEDLLRKLEKAWKKYLVLTAYEYEGMRNMHIHIRKFDSNRFGKPILRKIVEADGFLYFYIFERS